MSKYEWVFLNEIIGLELTLQLSAIREHIRKFHGKNLELRITVGDHVPFFIHVGDRHGGGYKKIPVTMFECELPPQPPHFPASEAEHLFKACQKEFGDRAKVILTDNRRYHNNPVVSIVIPAEQLSELYEDAPEKVIALG